MLHNSTVRCGSNRKRAINPARPALRACLSLASKFEERSERHQQGPKADGMNAIAKKLPPDGQLASEELKTQRIPKNIIRACELLASGECRTITAAAERVGVTREWLSRLLQRSHVQVFIARKSRENIQRGVLRASNRIVELLDAASEHVSLDASKHILAIEGIKPTADAQVSVNIDIKAGYVIDLTDEPKRMVDVTPTRSQAE